MQRRYWHLPLAVAGWLGTQLGRNMPTWLLPSTTIVLALLGVLVAVSLPEAPNMLTTEMEERYFAWASKSPDSYERISELKQFASRYGNRFTVLSTHPAAHVMVQAEPTFASDWPQNAEVHAQVLLPTLQTLLDNQVAYVFLQKDKLHRLDDPSRYGLLLGAYVQDQWEPVTEGKYFVVYRNPKVSDLLNPGLASAAHQVKR